MCVMLIPYVSPQINTFKCLQLLQRCLDVLLMRNICVFVPEQRLVLCEWPWQRAEAESGDQSSLEPGASLISHSHVTQ